MEPGTRLCESIFLLESVGKEWKERSDLTENKTDKAILALLEARDGKRTEVRLKDGSQIAVFNITYGYDIGDDWAHITTNISPPTDGQKFSFFFTRDVECVMDPESKEEIFKNQKLVKVLFRTEAGEVETLWANLLEGDCCQLDNNPMYPYSVSAGDIIEAPYNADEKMRTFFRVLEKSGNRTVRVIFRETSAVSEKTKSILQWLVAKGCDYEGLHDIHFSINIPPTADFRGIVSFLTSEKLQWEYADPTYEDVHGK
jgi:hypothetical protein